MPLLLQIGFGLSPFESGSLTFAAAAGAMAMKFTASRAHQALRLPPHPGRQRRDLGGVPRPPTALIGAATPHALIFLGLLIGGFFRSLEFTALNAIGYADVDHGADEPGHQLRQRLAADVPGGRRRRRRGFGAEPAMGCSATRRWRRATCS